MKDDFYARKREQLNQPYIAENNPEDEVRKLKRATIAEGIGMFFFVTSIGYAAPKIHLLFGLWVVQVFFAQISGAHFNPNVTFGHYLVFPRAENASSKFKNYVIAQVCGTSVAWLFAYWINHERIIAPCKGDEIKSYDAVVNEFFWGGLLVFCNLFVGSKTTSPSKSVVANVGFFTIFLYFLIGVTAPISGASLNPAIGFAGNLLAYLHLGNAEYLKNMIITTISNVCGTYVFSTFFKVYFEPLYGEFKKDEEEKLQLENKFKGLTEEKELK